MLKEFVDRILDLNTPVLQYAEGRTYSRVDLRAVSDPLAKAIELGTLTGLVQYLRENRDSLDRSGLVVHVESPDRVAVMSRLSSPWMLRQTFAVAERDKHGAAFDFGRYMDNESFIVQLQSRFQETEHLSKVLRIVGNLRDEKVQTATDDGVTQTVAVRAGVTLASEASVPNPVHLKPFRTFLEVEQPVSPFILRVKQGRGAGELPTCALFEADGGRWQLEAIEKIAAYLKRELSETGIAVIA